MVLLKSNKELIFEIYNSECMVEETVGKQSKSLSMMLVHEDIKWRVNMNTLLTAISNQVGNDLTELPSPHLPG
jgi:hypothetical protein